MLWENHDRLAIQGVDRVEHGSRNQGYICIYASLWQVEIVTLLRKAGVTFFENLRMILFTLDKLWQIMLREAHFLTCSYGFLDAVYWWYWCRRTFSGFVVNYKFFFIFWPCYEHWAVTMPRILSSPPNSYAIRLEQEGLASVAMGHGTSELIACCANGSTLSHIT